MCANVGVVLTVRTTGIILDDLTSSGFCKDFLSSNTVLSRVMHHFFLDSFIAFKNADTVIWF
jgi:hypothetical protein